MNNNQTKKFALIGVAGYVAPRHLQAIANSGHELVAAMDKSDSVGILDRYFPKASFFTEFERFDRHLNKLKSNNQGIDYLTVCTPNYLHDAHIRYGLRLGANVVCEKPIVLNPWNIDALDKLQKETNQRIYNILQLRLHPEMIELKKKVQHSDEFFNIDLTYITTRGNWYHASWKGNIEKSGGVATNIGIHFFDLLTWLFGEPTKNEVHLHTFDRSSGKLSFQNANVSWFLSISADTLPNKEFSSLRSFEINGNKIDLSYNFESLHTKSYQEILGGRGFDLERARSSINIASQIRNATPIGIQEDSHPLAHLELQKHPFN